MRLNPHLYFDGECEAAFKVYVECLGGEITLMMTWGESTLASTFPGFEDKVLHVTLKVGDGVLTGADVPHAEYEKPRGFTVQLNVGDVGDAERIFLKFAEGGTVVLALQETFWSRRFGIVTDRFGTPWEINCEEAGNRGWGTGISQSPAI